MRNQNPDREGANGEEYIIANVTSFAAAEDEREPRPTIGGVRPLASGVEIQRKVDRRGRNREEGEELVQVARVYMRQFQRAQLARELIGTLNPEFMSERLGGDKARRTLVEALQQLTSRKGDEER